MTLPDRLKQLRGERRLAEIAAVSGLSVSYLSDIENGRATPPLQTLARLSFAYKLPVVGILTGVDLGDWFEPIPFDNFVPDVR